MAEGKIARKKEDDEEEEEEEEDPDKSPMLELQVWDRDKLDDDFMGRVGIVDIFPLHVVWAKHCSLLYHCGKKKRKRAADPFKEPEKRSLRPSVLLRFYIRLEWPHWSSSSFPPVSFRLTINGGPLGTGRKGREKRGETVLLFSSSLSCCGGWPRTHPPVSLLGIHCGNSDEEKKSLSFLRQIPEEKDAHVLPSLFAQTLVSAPEAFALCIASHL